MTTQTELIPSASAEAENRAMVRVHPLVRAHAGDCTIYAEMTGSTLGGICVCGYGWECVRRGDWSKMFSSEWLEANKCPNNGVKR